MYRRVANVGTTWFVTLVNTSMVRAAKKAHGGHSSLLLEQQQQIKLSFVRKELSVLNSDLRASPVADLALRDDTGAKWG